MDTEAWFVMDGYTVILDLILLILTASNVRNASTTQQNRHYTWVLFWCLFLSLMDGISHVHAYGIDRVGTFMTYAMDPFGFLFETMYITSWVQKRQEQYRSFQTYIAAAAVVNFILVAYSAAFHKEWFYFFDALGQYHRGPLFLSRAGMLMINCFAVAVSVIIIRKDIHPAYRWAILLFPWFTVCGGILQITHPGIAYDYAAVTLACLHLYIRVESKDSSEDYLTGARNRRYLVAQMQTRMNAHQSFGGMMIDIDYFKKINDDYGHSMGDEALVSLCAMLSSLSGNFMVARLGGDEFFVVVDAEDIMAMEQACEQIRRAVTDFNRTKKLPFALSISIGYGLWDQKEDVDQFLKRLDEWMYIDKKAHHAERKS